jgi:hypothetical protein
MEHLQTRLEALEQRTHAVERQLRWWRGLACTLIGLALLTGALPSGTAQEESTAGSLAQRLIALEHTLRHLKSASDEEGRPEVVITGANLRIVNGLGRTDCTDAEGNPIPDCPNGLGNLIVGYNEPRPDPEDGGLNIRTGSHNVVVGRQHNFSRFGGIVVGEFNEISGDFAVVSGGMKNTASGGGASVSGGTVNRAIGDLSSVSGGEVNLAGGEVSSISGGRDSQALGRHSSVSGGEDNLASGSGSSVTGGRFNIASGGTVIGGRYNTASGGFATVCGGEDNMASGGLSSVSGGIKNIASGPGSSVSGGQDNEASGPLSSVSGGFERTAPGEFDWVAGPLFADE